MSKRKRSAVNNTNKTRKSNSKKKVNVSDMVDNMEEMFDVAKVELFMDSKNIRRQCKMVLYDIANVALTENREQFFKKIINTPKFSKSASSLLLERCCNENRYNFIELLLQKDNIIVNPMLSRDDFKLFQLFVQYKKVDINECYYRYDSGDACVNMLHLLCSYPYNEDLELLLDMKDIDVNKPVTFNGIQYTALMIACDEGHTYNVERLLDVDDIDIKYNNGQEDALSIARNKKHEKIVKLLENKI